ncbi:hypothetical protein LCGC14_0740820 [marine sediment metagenome]|uniref:Uncharacterized protein n=1 Tax=marine sediment metagenome TaxID=412755 RepID=A0A0F9QB02_9ZZZZ
MEKEIKIRINYNFKDFILPFKIDTILALKTTLILKLISVSYRIFRSLLRLTLYIEF